MKLYLQEISHIYKGYSSNILYATIAFIFFLTYICISKLNPFLILEYFSNYYDIIVYIKLWELIL